MHGTFRHQLTAFLVASHFPDAQCRSNPRKRPGKDSPALGIFHDRFPAWESKNLPPVNKYSPSRQNRLSPHVHTRTCHDLSSYSASRRCPYVRITSFLLSLSVGVISPASWENSSGTITNFLMVSKRASPALIVSIPS